ncbi:hypothetical protein Tco_0560975 [Tanacetum coccineum]
MVVTRSINLKKTNDEEIDDEFVHSDEYVHDNVDEEIKDAEVVDAGKEIPHIQSPSILTTPVLVIPKPTVLSPIPEIPTETLATTLRPPLSVTTIILVLQQSTPIPTPPITTVAPDVTMIPDPLPAIIQRVSILEKDIQELKEVDHTTTLLDSLISEIPSAQVDYKDFIEESVQANFINEVENLLPKFLPKAVSDFATPVIQSIEKKALEKTLIVLAQSSSQAQSSLNAAESLSEYELKTTLYEKTDKSHSYLTHDKHQALFDALLNSMCLDDSVALGQANPEKILRKRDHDDDNKDEDPPVGPNQRKKTKRSRTKKSEPSKKSSTTKESFKSKSPAKTSKSGKSVTIEEPIEEPVEPTFEMASDDIEQTVDDVVDDVVNDAERPLEDATQTKDKAPKKCWFKQPPRSPTLDPEWNKIQKFNDAQKQPWFNDLLFAERDPLIFDELMATPINFSKFAMNRLKIDKLTKAHLVGLVYKHLKGTCQSSVELEYNMEECYKSLSDQLDWNNPKGDHCPFDLIKPLLLKGRPGPLTVPSEYFFNNDLEYLKSSDPEKKYTTSITKIKAARYELVGIEDMIPNLWSVTKVGYNKDAERRIKH